jgi:hypothetical protein
MPTSQRTAAIRNESYSRNANSTTEPVHRPVLESFRPERVTGLHPQPLVLTRVECISLGTQVLSYDPVRSPSTAVYASKTGPDQESCDYEFDTGDGFGGWHRWGYGGEQARLFLRGRHGGRVRKRRYGHCGCPRHGPARAE